METEIIEDPTANNCNQENDDEGDLGLEQEQAAIRNITADRNIPEFDELKSLMDKAYGSTGSAVSNKKQLFSQLQDFFFCMCGQILELLNGYIIIILSFNFLFSGAKKYVGDKGKLKETIWPGCYLDFLNYTLNNGLAIMNCGCSLWRGLSRLAIPDGLLGHFQEFIAGPLTDEMKGKKIWDTFLDAKKELHGENMGYLDFQPPSSGFTKTSALLALRQKMWVKDFYRRLKERLGRRASEKCGKGKNPLVVKARREFKASELSKPENNVIPAFDDDWYPRFWLLFVYKGVASDDKEDGEHNPFKPKTNIYDAEKTLESVINNENARVSKANRKAVKDFLTITDDSPTESSSSSSVPKNTVITFVHKMDETVSSNEAEKGLNDSIGQLKEQVKFFEEEEMFLESEEIKKELANLYRMQREIIRNNKNKWTNETSCNGTANTPQQERIVRIRGESEF